MSRILRRPMFRGGRVDGRGTGIASGLGYADGGSVNTPKRGLVDGPGGYSGITAAWNLLKAGARPAMKYGKKGFDWLLRPQGFISKNSGKVMDAGYGHGKFATNRLSQGLGSIKNFIMGDPLVAGTAGTVKGAVKGGWGLRRKLPTLAALTGSTHYDVIPGEKTSEGWIGDSAGWIKDYWDEVFGDEPETPLGISQAEANALFGESTELANRMAGKSRAEAERVLKQKLDVEKQALLDAEKDTLENQILSQLNKKKTKKEKLAEMKENKEMLQEMYGTGRGEDASRMLLSAASRLLEPEATVKSAAGKFFGDEAKVESKRSKYKDAATQGAIQMYLTGEKDFNDLMKTMKLYDWQQKTGAKYKKEANDPANLDWSNRKTYYMQATKGKDRNKNNILMMALEDEVNEKGKSIFEVTDVDWITDPAKAAEMDDGLYIVSPSKGRKRIIEIQEGIVIDRSGDFPA